MFCAECGYKIVAPGEECPRCADRRLISSIPAVPTAVPAPAPTAVQQTPQQVRAARVQAEAARFDMPPVAPSNDGPSGLLFVLGFMLPVVGLIVWIAMKDAAPQRANSAGNGAFASVLVSLLMVFIVVVWNTFT